MENKSSIFVILAYLYLLIPNFIFFIGWCNVPTAIICSLVLIIGTYFLIKNAPKIWMPSSQKERIFIILLFLLSFLWVYFSGIGGFSYQNYDHSYRNEIYELLADRTWPVIIERYKAIMSYYIGFWLPSALLAKIAGQFIVGYFIQLLWASTGVFLFFYLILSTLKKKSFWVPLLFIFFSGLDIVGLYLFNKPNFTAYSLGTNIEFWAAPHNYSSMTTQLFWVFNQALPAWVFASILLVEKNNKNLLFLLVSLLIFSTLPAIGFIPFVLYLILKNGTENDLKIMDSSYVEKSIYSSLSIQNITALLVLFPVIFCYLSQNFMFSHVGVSKEVAETISLETTNLYFDFDRFFKYLRFFILEAGLFIICLFFFQRKNTMFYIVLFTLIFTVFFRIGFGLDFEMRVSIPALVFLFYLIVKSLQESNLKQHKIVTSILFVSLLIGSFTPLNEFARVYQEIKWGGAGRAKKIDLTLVYHNPNFYGRIAKSKFLKYFGKEILIKDQKNNERKN